MRSKDKFFKTDEKNYTEVFASFLKDSGDALHYNYMAKPVRIKLIVIIVPQHPESDYAEVILEKPAIGPEGPIPPIDICPDDLLTRNSVGLALGWGRTGDKGLTHKRTLNKVLLTALGANRDRSRLLTKTEYNGTILDVCRGDSGGPLLYKKEDHGGWEDYKNLCLMATVEGGSTCGALIERGEMYSFGYWNYVPEMTKSIQKTEEESLEHPTTQSPVKKGTYFKRQETL